jgi:tetratricopeptide (TPR) repeat protein
MPGCVQAVEAGELQVALAQYTTAIKEPDDSSETQQNTFELAQVHQSRGAVLYMLGEEYAEDSAAAESMGVKNAHSTIAKLAAQMAQAFPACLEAATDRVKAGVKKEEGNALVKNKKFAEALESYSAALELDPTEHTIWYEPVNVAVSKSLFSRFYLSSSQTLHD